MHPDIDSLSREVARLAEAFTSLGERLKSVGDQLQGGGEPPSEDLIADQVKLVEEFRGLRVRVAVIAASLPLEPPMTDDQVPRLADLSRLVARLVDIEFKRAASNESRRRSIAILEKIHTLKYLLTGCFEPLHNCQRLASELHHQIEQADPDRLPEVAASLAGGSHPFVDLLDLAEKQGTLDDDEFARKESSVRDAFGEPLRLAVLRGRIVLGTTSDPIHDALGQETSSPPATHGRPLPSPTTVATEAGQGELRHETPDPPSPARCGTPRLMLGNLGKILDFHPDPGYAYLPLTVAPCERDGGGVPEDEPEVVVSQLDAKSGAAIDEAESGSTDLPSIPESFEPAAETRCEGEILGQLGQETSRLGSHRGPYQATDAPEVEVGLRQGPDEEVLSALGAVAVTGSTRCQPPGRNDDVVKMQEPDESEGQADAVERDATVPDLAASALRSGPPYQPHRLRDVVSGLIRDGRFGLAYHLARCLEAGAPGFQQRVPPELIRAVCLGRQVRYEVGELAGVLTDDLTAIADRSVRTNDPSWDYAIHILRAASALRPALLAPRTNASRVLHSLHLPGLDTLFAYCQTIARFGDRLNPLDTNALKRVKDEAAWEEELTSFVREASRWYEQARQRSLAFVGATKVLHRWLEPGGVVFALLDPVLRNDRRHLGEIAGEAERLSVDSEVRREVNNSDRPASGHRPRGEPIVATAYTQLKERMREAVAIARGWVDLHASRPDHIPAHQQRMADELRRELGNRHDRVIEELAGFSDEADRLATVAAATACRHTVQEIRQLFDRDAEVRADETDLRHLLHGELLLVPGLALDEDWLPSGTSSEQLATSILTVLADPGRGWKDAYEDHKSARDHRATAMVIRYLGACPQSDAQLADEFARARSVDIEECRDALRRDCDFARKELEDATSQGLIREEERAKHDATIASIESSLMEIERFRTEHIKLVEIAAVMEEKRQKAVEEAWSRLDGSGIAPDHPDRARIEQVLGRGDVLTANEYIQALIDGQPLPLNPEQPDHFAQFFPDAFHQLEVALTKRAERPDSEIVAKVRNGESLPGLSMREVPGAQAQRAAKMLEAWFTAKKQRRISEEQVRAILETIGFKTRSIEVKNAGQRVRVEVVTDPLRDRDLCPIDAFGSLVDGHYRILCDWGRSSEEDLLNELSESARDVAYIVFYLGRLTGARRRNLARLCHDPKRRRKMVVVDDILLIHLCGVRGSRLPVFFDCTLPFSFAMPYTTAASLVSPEMFYGRSREIEDIIDPMGTCFIFGGRQLGKTALLRHVERTFLLPLEDRVAFWIDLKERGVGYAFGADQIRVALADELKRHMVIPATVPPGTGLDRILDHVRSWIDSNPRRRLLVLLDEADNFLKLDAEEGFTHTDRFRGLMVATNRRFKVVFAGLHNVQRTTRQANHPLAHFGEARSIGPLLNGRDARDARDLIERPLRSLGYKFEGDDLVTRILAQTNYYPSLIQLYCNALLKHLAEQHDRFDPRSTPPFVITSRHLQDVYQDRELRRSIRDKLSLTLRLDPRYEVIAYVIAYGFSENRTLAMTQGFPASWIREESLYWYRDGFRDAAEDSFRVLLDEMVGLGVLREGEPGFYTLRSPNVAALLGTESEVMAVLTRERTPPPVYEPATFRSAYRGARGSDQSRRSPLTADQMSILRRRENGVSLLLGTAAAGLDEIAPFLRLDSPDEFFVELPSGGKPDFTRLLSELGSRAREGVVLVLVGASCDWESSWVEMALEKTGRLKSTDSFVRVCFVADPPKVWSLTGWEAAHPGFRESRGLTTLELKPWHDAALVHWLLDCDFSITDEQRGEITRVTGNWPLLLRDFYDRAKNDTVHWENHLRELDSQLAEPSHASKLLDAFGVEDRRDRLVLSTLQSLQEPDGKTGVPVEDLAALVEGVSEDWIRRALRWADLLQLVHPVGAQAWRIDLLVGRLLVATGE